MDIWKAAPAELWDVIVVGAGASGLMAAISAAREVSKVLVLEHTGQVGKKILATGNGHCNFTNKKLSAQDYYCQDKDFADRVLKEFDTAAVLSFFQELGIRSLQKNGTCLYPESEQASSVRAVLLEETQRLGVEILYEVRLKNIKKGKKEFKLTGDQETYYCKSLILATGGKAAPKTGSDGSGYSLAKQLGHRLIPALPGLVPLEADFGKYRLPAGVRLPAGAVLCIEGQKIADEIGELQITQYGLSGILIFQLSRIAARALADKKEVIIELDFKPTESMEELEAYLGKRFESEALIHKSIKEALLGFVPDKMIPVLLQKAGIKAQAGWEDTSPIQRQQLVKACKRFKVKIIGIKGFDMAQVTAGGIDIGQIIPQTMASCLVGGLYFAGELVDVDGKCGGYNLHWAWATGHLAGLAAADYSKRRGKAE